MIDKLPEGWTYATLADVVDDLQAGFASGKKDVDGGISQLRMNNIGVHGELILDLVRSVPEELARENYFLVPGDVLVCTTNSGKLVGKCTYFNLPGRYTFSNHLTRLRSNPDLIDGQLLRWVLWNLWKSGAYEEKTKHWVNQSAIPKEALLGTEIVIAPRDEQRRISLRLEIVLAKVQQCKERIEKVPALLKRFRQSVLAAACSGRLTADWRENHFKHGDAEKIVRRLETAHDMAGGHKRGNAAPPTDDVHDLDVGDFPAGWCITDLKTAVRPDRPITYGILKPGPNISGGIPYVRVADFPGDRLDLGNIRRTSKGIDQQYARARLRAGDILLSIRGTVGRVCRVPQELENANITQDTARLTIQDQLNPAFVMWFLRAPETQKRMQRAIKGVAIRGINIGDVRALQLPVPSIDEQNEIVRRVESLLSIADSLEARYEIANARVQSITQSVLAAAFRGELVPTEAELAEREGRDYESAARLLERVRAARIEPVTDGTNGTARTRRHVKQMH